MVYIEFVLLTIKYTDVREGKEAKTLSVWVKFLLLFCCFIFIEGSVPWVFEWKDECTLKCENLHVQNWSLSFFLISDFQIFSPLFFKPLFDAQQVSENQVVFQLPQCDSINHIVVCDRYSAHSGWFWGCCVSVLAETATSLVSSWILWQREA